MDKVGWANLVFLNLLWPVHIVSAAAGMAWPGPLMVVVYGAWQLHARHRTPGDRRIVLVAFLVASFWHAKLGLQVIVEDYVHTPWLAATSQLAVIFVCALAAIASVLAVIRIALGG